MASGTGSFMDRDVAIQFFVIWVVLGFVFFLIGRSELRSCEKDAQEAARGSYSAKAEKEKPEAPATGDRFAQRLKERIEANGEEKHSKGFCDFKTSDLLTMLGVWLTIGVAVIQVFFLAGSLEVAGRSARAAEKSAKATIDANAPYLLPDDFEAQGFFSDLPAGDTRRPFMTYSFKNHGKTPAIIRRWRDYSLLVPELPARPFTDRWERPADQYIPVAAGENGGGLWVQIPRGTTREQVFEATGPNPTTDRRLFIIGEVEYDDAFGITRVQGFCLRVLWLAQATNDRGFRIELAGVWRDGGRVYNDRREV